MNPRLGAAVAMLVAGCLPVWAPLSAQGPVPTAPQNVRGSAAGSTLTLAWDPPASGAPIYYYVVDIGQQPGVYDASVPVGLLTTVSADVDDGVYYFRVYAVNAHGPGAASLEVAVAVGAGSGLPGAPQNLAAGVLPDLVTLTWDPPAEGLPLTGYVLYAGTFPGTSNALRLPIGSTSSILHLPLTGVAPGTYFLRIAAVNGFGEGPVSNEVSITVLGSRPGAPQNLVASVTNEVLTLTWEPPVVNADNVRYVLLIADHPERPPVIRVGLGTGLSYTRYLGSWARFYVRVAAINQFGEGPPSNMVSIVYGPTEPPGPPQSPVATLSGDVIAISWLPPATGEPIVSYTVHLSQVPGGDHYRISAGAGTSITIPWAGAAPGTYWFFVTATNAFGQGAPSANVSVTIGPGSPPAPPAGLQVVVENGVLMAVWSSPFPGNIPLTGHVLHVGTSPGTSNVLRQPLGLTPQFTTTVAGATPGIYYFRVTAVNMFGEGAPSNEVSVVIGPYCAIPSAPVVSGSVSGGTVSLSWTTPAGGPVTGYTLFVAPGPGQPFTELATLGAVNEISGPASPGTYLVRVAANAACGQGPPSNTVTMTVP